MSRAPLARAKKILRIFGDWKEKKQPENSPQTGMRTSSKKFAHPYFRQNGGGGGNYTMFFLEDQKSVYQFGSDSINLVSHQMKTR